MKKTALHVAILTAVCLVLFFFRLGSVGLMEPDEGRNAEVAREILATGDWVTPHLDLVRYLDKPIFFFWASALSMKLFGVNEFAARFPSALAALIGVIAVYFLGRRIFGEKAGLLSALILATSPFVYGLGRIVLFDMMLTAFITLGLLSFILGFTEEAATRKRLFYILFWAALALAVLTKGPIGAIFPLGIIFLFLVFTGNLRRIREMEPWLGPLVFLAIAAPWYVLVSMRNPEYPYYFFISEHFLRYATTKYHHVRTLWYYFPTLAVGFLPWIFFLPSAITSSIRSAKEKSGREYLIFIGIWAGLIFLFFSGSTTKMPAYILPMFPAVALMTGKAWSDELEGRTGRFLFGVPFYVLIACVLALGAAIAFSSSIVGIIEKNMSDAWTPELLSLLRSSGIAALVFGLASLSAALLRENRTARFASVFVLALLLFSAGLVALKWESSLRSTKAFAERVRAELRPEDTILTYEFFPSSFLFYLREQVPAVSQYKGVLGSNFMLDYNQNYQGARGSSIMDHSEFRTLLADRKKRIYILTRGEETGNWLRTEAGAFGRPELVMEQGNTFLWKRKESR